MKKLILITLLLTISVISFGSKLFLLPTGSLQNTKEAFNNNKFLIHYYNDDFLIGSTDSALPENSVLLDNLAWQDSNESYYILQFDRENRTDYLETISHSAEVLYATDEFAVVSTLNEKSSALFPAVHGGIICISQKQAKFPPKSLDYKPGSLSFRDDISDMITEVNIDTLESYVQHLQDFGTRNAYKAGSIQAQNWILSKFQSFGLDVELDDFNMPGGAASDNVIATLPGTVYPDEYVILGAHYDSYVSGTDNEPGADDNASGAAGILEAARIMSQYQFDRTIIFATWSGEEYGLYGSAAWASMAADDGLNILGYFNIDMAGYLAAGEQIHTDIIAPSSAAELRQFYKDVCAIYLPDFQVFDGTLSGGDSDHTSFNNNGFQGIFPFEDSQHYSPYIHTVNDLIGTSVNNFEQQMTFVKAIIANVASMSNQLPAPQNVVAVAGDSQVDLSWDSVEGTLNYNVYRDGGTEPYASITETYFTDNDVINGTQYTYFITAVFEDSGEESGPSDEVTVVPMPPISFPFFDDFESGAPYWTMEGTWGLQIGTYHSSEYAMTESPSGNYQANLDISTTLRGLNLTGATSAEISFWTRYNIESGYDFTYLLVSTDGISWDQLAQYSGVENSWVEKTYSLNDYLGKSNVLIRFRFTSDIYIEAQGIFIDDFAVEVSGVGVGEENGSALKTNLFCNPNPAKNRVSMEYWLAESGHSKVIITDALGNVVKTIANDVRNKGGYHADIDISDLSAGIYFAILELNGRKISRKLVINK